MASPAIQEVLVFFEFASIDEEHSTIASLRQCRPLPGFFFAIESLSNMSHLSVVMSASTNARSPQIPLLHRVDKAIRHHPHLAGRHLILEANAGAVILRGTVDSYFEKQMAQEALRGIEGITEILNQLEVAYGKPRCR